MTTFMNRADAALTLAIVCVFSLSAGSQTLCTSSQVAEFTARCMVIGEGAAHAETSCVQAYGNHDYCGSYPWPSRVFAIEPNRLECRIYWVRSPKGQESPIPSSIGTAEVFDCPIPFKVALSGPSVTKALPAGPAIALLATVTQSGAPAAGKGVNISLGSGGAVSGTTDSAGEFAFTYTPPAFATSDTITGTCSGCAAPATKTITVESAELMCPVQGN